jgi:hypothetical protein
MFQQAESGICAVLESQWKQFVQLYCQLEKECKKSVNDVLRDKTSADEKQRKQNNKKGE